MGTIQENEIRAEASASASHVAPHELLPVISVGTDQKLLKLREEIIRNIGLVVQSRTPDEACSAAHSSNPHLWIFCSTVELIALVGLASTIRECSSKSQLLLLEGSRPIGEEASLFHGVVDPLQIDLMVSTIKHLAVGSPNKRR